MPFKILLIRPIVNWFLALIQIWELTASYYAKYLKNRDIEKIQCSKCGFQAVYLCTQCSLSLRHDNIY